MPLLKKPAPKKTAAETVKPKAKPRAKAKAKAPADPIETLIKEMTASDKKRDRGLKPPADVERWTNIPYGSDPKSQSLDVYRPKEDRGTLPVIISVHGGGWIYGSKELYQHYCMSLAQRGFAVINYSYRLAPEYKFPACIEDENAVFQWMVDHARQYGLDVDHVFAVGDSAGANQLAIYCCMLADKRYAVTYPFPLATGFRLRAVALNCGLYDLIAGASANDGPIYKILFPHGGTEAELHHMSPIEHIAPAFPPAFVMTAKGDFLVQQAPALVKALQAQQVPCVEKVYGTEEEPLAHVFHCNMKLPQAKVCNDDQCAFFRRFLG